MAEPEGAGGPLQWSASLVLATAVSSPEGDAHTGISVSALPFFKMCVAKNVRCSYENEPRLGYPNAMLTPLRSPSVKNLRADPAITPPSNHHKVEPTIVVLLLLLAAVRLFF